MRNATVAEQISYSQTPSLVVSDFESTATSEFA